MDAVALRFLQHPTPFLHAAHVLAHFVILFLFPSQTTHTLLLFFMPSTTPLSIILIFVICHFLLFLMPCVPYHLCIENEALGLPLSPTSPIEK